MIPSIGHSGEGNYSERKRSVVTESWEEVGMNREGTEDI